MKRPILKTRGYSQGTKELCVTVKCPNTVDTDELKDDIRCFLQRLRKKTGVEYKITLD